MFSDYLKIITDSYQGYANYLWVEISSPSWHNYFYWLLGVSLLFFLLEIVFPWRRSQLMLRKDFWLDVFYMFFNFFLFSLIIYNAASNVLVQFFKDILNNVGIKNLVAIEVSSWSMGGQLFALFIIRDFIHWWVHRLLHRVEWLWQFHKVHHSVEEMGFAAHLRYHWMENIVYKTLEYLPLAMIGFGIDDFFIVHVFTLSVGHFNHSNFKLNIGWFRYLFNNPRMHIWHHAYELPDKYKFGVNFGLTLSVWDYIFKTAYVPFDGKDIKLGFPNVKRFPNSFVKQSIYGFKKE